MPRPAHRVSRPAAGARLAVVLPLILGVIVMHVLLLCAAPQASAHSRAAHGSVKGHGELAAAASVAAHDSASLPTSAAPVASPTTPAPPHHDHDGADICLAVLAGLVALAALGLRLRLLAEDPHWPGLLSISAPRLSRAPPPRADLQLLCVSRT